MTTPPARSSLSGDPSRATYNGAIGQLYDWLVELLGGGSSTAAEKAAARASLQAGREMQPISASVASNALTLTLNPTSLDFRSATLGNGVVNTRVVSAALNLVVSNGSTLGTTSGQLARLAVLALDNAGAVELAVVNLAGGVNLDESGLISTTAEGGAGAADSASTVYSAVARSNVPFRILGFVEVTQATAGLWVSAPAVVSGILAPFAKWYGGFGQRPQSVIGSRAFGTTYTNTTGRPIDVSIEALNTTNSSYGILVATVEGVALAQARSVNNSSGAALSFRVGPGETYVVTNSGTALGITVWTERR